MSGKPGFNIPAFDKAKAWLEANTNCRVISPPDLDSSEHKQKCLGSIDGEGHPDGVSWLDYLVRDLRVLETEVDAIALLPGWHSSDGSQVEVRAALKLGLNVFEFNQFPVPGWAPRWIMPVTHDEVRQEMGEGDDCEPEGVSPEEERRKLAEIGLSAAGEGPVEGLKDTTMKFSFGPVGIVADSRPPEGVVASNTEIFVDGKPLDSGLRSADSLRADLSEAFYEALDAMPKGGLLDGEERVVNKTTGGAKGRKAQRFELLPYDALGKVAEVYAAGATKYEDRNWERGYEWSLSFGALQRHLAAFWQGEDNDPEFGLPHLAHAAFHVLGLLHYSLDDRYAEMDDRPVKVVA